MLMNERRPLSLGDYPVGNPDNSETWRTVQIPHFLRADFDYEAIKSRHVPLLTDIPGASGIMLRKQAA